MIQFPLLAIAAPPAVSVGVGFSSVSIADLGQDIHAWDPDSADDVGTILAKRALAPLKQSIPIFYFCANGANGCTADYQLTILIQRQTDSNRIVLKYSLKHAGALLGESPSGWLELQDASWGTSKWWVTSILAWARKFAVHDVFMKIPVPAAVTMDHGHLSIPGIHLGDWRLGASGLYAIVSATMKRTKKTFWFRTCEDYLVPENPIIAGDGYSPAGDRQGELACQSQARPGITDSADRIYLIDVLRKAD